MRLYKYFPAMAAALVVGCSAVFAASADDGDVQIVMPSEPEYTAEEAVTDHTKAEDIDSVIVNADITDSTTSSDAFDAEKKMTRGSCSDGLILMMKESVIMMKAMSCRRVLSKLTVITIILRPTAQ